MILLLPLHLAAAPIEIPRLAGPWVTIAPNAPEIGDWATGQENACDFTIFRGPDGWWRCYACIRGTKAPGQRLFYQWRSPELLQPDWTPHGLFDVPRGGETSVQAPHGFFFDGRYWLFYNSAGARGLTSADAETWQPLTNTAGEAKLFDMGRDVQLVRDEANDRWLAYYTGSPQPPDPRAPGHAMVARTAPTLAGPWSAEAVAVRTSGNPESPFVVRRGDAWYLFQQMAVYRSTDPLDFNGPIVAHLTGLWFSGRYAPEIIRDGERWYVAGYSRGIHLAPLEWVSRTPAEIDAWRAEWTAYLADQERLRAEREKQRQAGAAGRP